MQVQLAQGARQALQEGGGVTGLQVLGAQLAGLAIAQQQFATVTRVKAAAAAGVQQVIGTGHPQEKMAVEVDSGKRDVQASSQLQRNHRQGQGLALAALQDLMQQGAVRAWQQLQFRVKTQRQQAAHQGLGQFVGRQAGQAGADLMLQVIEALQHLGGLQL